MKKVPIINATESNHKKQNTTEKRIHRLIQKLDDPSLSINERLDILGFFIGLYTKKDFDIMGFFKELNRLASIG